MEKRPRILPLILLLLPFGCTTPGVANDPSGAPLDPSEAQPGPSARPEQLEIEVDRPEEGQHVRQPSPLIEVAGRAGSLPFVASDVVLLIDHSTLAVIASRVDVDGDGVVGRNRSAVTQWDPFERPTKLFTTDSGDTIQALQLKVARALVPRLVARGNRVGLASLALRARIRGGTVVRLTEDPPVIVPVGNPDPVRQALDEFPEAYERRWTNLELLLQRGAELLDDATPPGAPQRQRALLLLSLGQPTAPDGLYWSSRKAVERAQELGERGIAVWAIPFGTPDSSFLEELTEGSGGSVLPFEVLASQFGASELVDLRPTKLEVENLTTSVQATSVEVFSDGRFQAAVPCEPGPNLLEIRAVLADGQHATAQRTVHYEVGAVEDPGEDSYRLR